jgi:hypothetical protein
VLVIPKMKVHARSEDRKGKDLQTKFQRQILSVGTCNRSWRCILFKGICGLGVRNVNGSIISKGIAKFTHIGKQ